MASPLGKPSDKVDHPERRPGFGLAQRGAGRGASCRKKHSKNGALMLPLPHLRNL
ncbi:MAG: hypothetical protein ACREUJ_04620 [Burkholderiales bacterium]